MTDEVPEKGEASKSPFSIPLFRTMWIAAMVSNVGTMIQSVGAGWVMTTLSDSPVMVALIQASASLPTMLFALLSGAIADNFDRRRVMLIAQVFMLVASVILTLLAMAGLLSPLILLVFTFLIASGAAVNWPAMQVSFAEIVPRTIMPRAVALNGMGMNIARSIGPALGGAIIAIFGAAMAFGLNALSFLGLIAVLISWKYAPQPRLLPRERLGAAMAAGLRYSVLSPAIGSVLLRAATYGAAGGAVQALMPLIARDLLHGGALTFGLLLGAFGLGAVGGALISAWMRERWTTETIVRNACLLAAAGSVLAAASTLLPLTFLAMAMAGACWLIMLSTFNVTIQLSSPRWVVARALSLYQMAVYGGVAIGSWGFGSLAERLGCPVALYTSGAGLAIVALIGLYAPIRARTEADLDPRVDWRVPETSVPVNPNSGPVVLAVEYRVRTEAALRFSALMQHRSRILRRDGARRWSLSRDLADPELWIEHYHLPTWFDYIQLNRRRTQDDLSIQEQLHAILIPGTEVVVRRMIERQSGALPWSRSPDHSMIEPTAKGG